MISWRMLSRVWATLFLSACVLPGCESADTGVGTTSNDDFTLTLQVPDKYIHVGDQAPITVRLRRTDNSNLQKGMERRIAITTSVHGTVDIVSMMVQVDDDTTAEIVQTVIFTARESGIAEVRASFLDATALIKILISRVDT